MEVPQSRISSVPDATGVYMFLDSRGRALYVGKAVSLRSRVRTYFTPSGSQDPRTQKMASEVSDVQFVVTDSETEALILESNLIKRHRPPYNVRLRDDKNYPYLKVTWEEEYPRLEVARRIQDDGGRYFGPYTRSGDVRETMKVLRRAFPHRSCSLYQMRTRHRPCLNHQMGLCPAPCCREVSPEDYRQTMEELCRFLAGRQTGLLRGLEERMMEKSRALEYEAAAALRDQREALGSIVQSQKVITARRVDLDLVAVASREDDACAQVFLVREGRLVGQEHFFLTGADQVEAGNLMGAFLKQYYSDAAMIPGEVLVSVLPTDLEAVAEYLSALRDRNVILRQPQRGPMRQLADLALENAGVKLKQEEARQEADRSEQAEALEDLVQSLDLEAVPAVIEGYDVSNLKGQEAVGSMVVFREGAADPSSYRRFRLSPDTGPDDYALMGEMLERRLSRQEEWPLPDLILVDGGPGQVQVAHRSVQARGLAIPVLGLAKREELIHRPGSFLPVRLERSAPGLRLLQRIRDEAHRFAVTYHRKLRGRKRRVSWLESVEGIGPKRRKALLRHFGSLQRISEASEEELFRVPGMTRSAARSLARKIQDWQR